MHPSFDPSVSPIYQATSSGLLIHRGTCLLVKTTNRFWVFTASHVVVDRNGADYEVARLWLPGNPFQPIDTENIYFCSQDIDVAFFELSVEKATAVAAGQAAFLSASALAPMASVSGRALVKGYPDKAIEPDGGELTIDVRQFHLRSPFLTEEELLRANLDPFIHVAVHAKKLRDDETKEKTGPIDFHGLSGGVVQQDGANTAPIALVTDYDPKYQIIIGTRLYWLVRQLARKIEAEIISVESTAKTIPPKDANS